MTFMKMSERCFEKINGRRLLWWNHTQADSSKVSPHLLGSLTQCCEPNSGGHCKKLLACCASLCKSSLCVAVEKPPVDIAITRVTNHQGLGIFCGKHITVSFKLWCRWWWRWQRRWWLLFDDLLFPFSDLLTSAAGPRCSVSNKLPQILPAVHHHYHPYHEEKKKFQTDF